MANDILETDDALGVLTSQDSSFQELLKDITESTVSWQHFLKMRIPRGATVESTWRSIHEINRSAGCVLPDFQPNVTIFYRYSMEMVESFYQLLLTLLKLAGKQSFTDFENNSTFRLDFIRNAVSAAALDGLEASQDAVIEAFDNDQPPSEPADRIAFNTAKLMRDVNEYKSADIDVLLLKRIYEQVTMGVDPAELPERKPLLTCMVPEGANDRAREAAFDRRAGLVMDYLAGRIGEHSDMDITRFFSAPMLLCSFVPLSCLAQSVGAIISQILFVKSELPLLSKISMSFARFQWELRSDGYPGISFSRSDVIETQGQEKQLGMYDVTLQQTVNYQLGLVQARKLLGYADYFSRQTDQVRSSLQKITWFNARQKNVLTRAAKGPDRKFTIKYHQTNHGISYATARRDFQELLDAGYLTSTFSGKTQVFEASPNLLELLSVRVGLETDNDVYPEGFMTRA